MSNPQTEAVFQNCKDKEFNELTDHEKYHRTQHHMDQKEKEANEATDPETKAELQRKVESLKNARDQWKDAK